MLPASAAIVPLSLATKAPLTTIGIVDPGVRSTVMSAMSIMSGAGVNAGEPDSEIQLVEARRQQLGVVERRARCDALLDLRPVLRYLHKYRPVAPLPHNNAGIGRHALDGVHQHVRGTRRVGQKRAQRTQCGSTCQGPGPALQHNHPVYHHVDFVMIEALRERLAEKALELALIGQHDLRVHSHHARLKVDGTAAEREQIGALDAILRFRTAVADQQHDRQDHCQQQQQRQQRHAARAPEEAAAAPSPPLLLFVVDVRVHVLKKNDVGRRAPLTARS
eukprot:358113-Chlamydomonas_euryale.AAC.1